MAKARRASVTQSKLGMILYGEQFTGKSTMAMQLAYFKRPDGKPFRVLYIDPETGSIDDYLPDLEANGVNLDNIYIVYTRHWSKKSKSSLLSSEVWKIAIQHLTLSADNFESVADSPKTEFRKL